MSLKQSELSFADGFSGIQAAAASEKGNKMQAFDWDKAAQIIKEKLILHPDLVAEAGLQGDWEYTGGIIFETGKPVKEDYTYLASNWATPTLILSWDKEEQEEIPCFIEQNDRFKNDSKWDVESLSILGINIE